MEIGICQTQILAGDKKYNLIQAEDYIVKCKENGVSLAVFPEMSMTGYTIHPEAIAETQSDHPTIDAMISYATKYEIATGFGYVRMDEGKYTNRYVIVDKMGRIICDYGKIHPFSYAGEHKNYEKGQKISLCNIDGISICPFICYDLRFPEIFQIASAKADVIIVAANWGGQRDEHWQLLLQARALENQCYVIGVNRIGEDEENYCVGNSMIVDPYGRIIDILDDGAGILTVSVNKDVIDAYRQEFPVKRDRRPDLYSKLSDF